MIYFLISLILVVGILIAVVRSRSSANAESGKGGKEIGQEPSAAPGTPERKGQDGEREVKRILSFLPSDEYLVLNDVLLPTKSGTTQLDHIVISLYGIFVIETKNYSGTLYGGKNSEEWTQYIKGEKYVFHNPLKQNEGHRQAIAQYLHLDLRHIVPIVVFTGSARIKAMIGEHVVLADGLYDKIMQHREPVFTPLQMLRYAGALDDALEENSETRQAHVDSVRERVCQRNLEISSGNCPLCDGQLVLRSGKYGAFYGCSNYPRCEYIKNID